MPAWRNSKETDLYARPFDNDLFHPLPEIIPTQLTAEVFLQRAKNRIYRAS